MKSTLAFLVGLLATASAADCTTEQFSPMLALAKDPTSSYALCAKDMSEDPANMAVPGWVPTTKAMFQAFSTSANCKAFYTMSMTLMKAITPPCSLTVNGMALTTETFSAIDYDTAVATMKATWNSKSTGSSNSTSTTTTSTTAPATVAGPTTAAPATTTPKPTPKPKDCAPDEFSGMLAYASDPKESYAKCSKDINEDITNMAKTGWAPATKAMVDAFSASDNCRSFYRTSMQMYMMYTPPCIVHQLGLALPTNILGAIPFDTAVMTMRAALTRKATPTTAPTSSSTTIGVSVLVVVTTAVWALI
ncbi:hypothetical protein THRCLA_07232 [Thraustotheca clavata]|uniref:Secreted protein n=1 Tax=Thraustotheca clavata TaxID=74557 RepID=A0A0A7CLG7_9STRA|nr:secreted protein [Thraustotheca clavata]OQR96618.1 hypothetical protein THRCLA_07232 [Thraustotheca clavata]